METDKDSTFCYYSGLPSPLAYAEENIGNSDIVVLNEFTLKDIDRIIEMAWEDRTPFDAIKFQFGINEAAVKVVMKNNLKFSSYKLWRNRVENCKTKHAKTRNNNIDRFKCSLQRNISLNKISKRK